MLVDVFGVTDNASPVTLVNEVEVVLNVPGKYVCETDIIAPAADFIVVPETVIPFPPVYVTPGLEFVIVTPPVEAETEIPVPAAIEVTPEFAIVTAEEPLYEVPDNPVPIVRAFGLTAVIVALPPKAIAVLLTVIEEFVNCALVIVPLKLAVVYPVQFVKVPEVGVPKTGVTKVGEVANATTVPEPVVVYDVPQAEPVEFAIPAPG